MTAFLSNGPRAYGGKVNPYTGVKQRPVKQIADTQANGTEVKTAVVEDELKKEQ